MPQTVESFLNSQRNEIEEKILTASAWPTYLFPWDGLEAQLHHAGRLLTLIAYGSLINAGSWKNRNEIGQRDRPMLAFGVRRVFDYEMDEAACKRYGQPRSPDERGALNAYVEGLPNLRMYGMGINYTPEEIPHLREREVAYDLVPVACARLTEQGEISPEVSLPLEVAYVLACPARPWKGRFYTHPHVRPHREYYKVCAAGCSKISRGFLESWKETTYLADRITTVARWVLKSGIEHEAGPAGL